MQLVYNGPKKERIMGFPMPVLSKSAVEGTVTFVRGKASDVPDVWAEQCLAIAPEYFTKVESKQEPKKG